MHFYAEIYEAVTTITDSRALSFLDSVLFKNFWRW